MDRLIILLLCLASCRTPKPAPQPETSEVAAATLPAQDEPTPPSLETNLPDPSPGELERLSTWLAAQETGFELERLEDCEAQLLVRADRLRGIRPGRP